MRLYGTIIHNSPGGIDIHIDIQNWELIKSYIEAEDYTGVEFSEILEIVLNGLQIPEKFGPLKVAKGHRDYFEMVFSRSNRDDRILCRRYKGRNCKDIILIKLFRKVPGENIQEKMIEDIIETGGYDYDIQ